MRKPVQIVTGTTQGTGTEVGHMIYALCDDGSMWSDGGSMWFTDGRQWGRLPDIPQDEPEQTATSPDVVAALRELAKAEVKYREALISFGARDPRTGLAWETMHQAGNAARDVLKWIDAPYSSE